MKKILLSLLLLLFPICSYAQSATITWDDQSDNEQGLHCERQANDGSFSQVCEVGPNIQTWTDTQVATGNQYCYKVRSYNEAGESTYSNKVHTTLTAEAPNTILNPSSATISEVAPTGLVLAMSLNAGTGTTAADTSGNNNTGTISGATWTTSGKYGSALTFNGENDTISVPDADSLHLTAGMTLEAWVYPTEASNWRTIILKEASNWRTVILKERAGDLVYSLYTSDRSSLPSAIVYIGTKKQYLDGPAALPLNTWSHLAATYDGAQYRMFVNGVQVSARVQTGAIVTSTGALRIGGNSVWGEYLKGRIDEIKIYNRALTPAEILADMNTP